MHVLYTRHVKNLWYYSGLLFVLAILGIGSGQTVVPNQEIVIQFSDADVTPDETQATLGRIKSQLELLAVTNIKLQEQVNGTLKITYYSDVSVSKIKKFLLQEQKLSYTSTVQTGGEFDFPIDNDESTYQIGIQKIQKAEDLAGTKSGVLESKSESIRFSTPNTYAAVIPSATKYITRIDIVAYSVYKDVAIALNNADYKIPEVRAGPLA